MLPDGPRQPLRATRCLALRFEESAHPFTSRRPARKVRSSATDDIAKAPFASRISTKDRLNVGRIMEAGW